MLLAVDLTTQTNCSFIGRRKPSTQCMPIGWLAAGTMPNSLCRMPLVYLSLACVFCYSCSFLFVVFCVFVFFFCSYWSLVDVPLISFCPADHVPDWQPRILLGMVEARSVNVKKQQHTTLLQNSTGLHAVLVMAMQFIICNNYS